MRSLVAMPKHTEKVTEKLSEIKEWNVAEWLERLTANAEVATVLCSIPASSDTAESNGVADEAVLGKEHT